jgi:hypothetical protein
MPISAGAVVYTVAGGLILYSGVKGDTLADMGKAVLTGNLGSITDTETIGTPSIGVSTAASPGSDSGTGGTTDAGTASESAAANQAVAKQIIQANSAYKGWDTGQNWTDLVSLWNQESGWSATAYNASSGAYGIAQALPASKYPAAGQKSGGSNPGAQISWGLSYIKQRYGSPALAWAHEQSNNWY